MSKIILDLCGGTGSWSKPYADAGYDVRLVTLPDCDVTTYHPPSNVHGILSAPPCDHFSVSGAQYWKEKDKDGRTALAAEVVRACLRIIDEAKPAWWALENPVGRIRDVVPELGGSFFQFDPCDFGDPYTKKTRLWGEFRTPKVRPVDPVYYTTTTGKRGSWAWAKLGGKSEKTKRLRSMTPQGFARAFFEANP